MFKNRKFLASSITAAAVAISMGSVVSAEDATSFKDVAPQYKTAVDYLVSNGFTKGFSATQFGTDSNIKRADAAVLVAKAMGFSEKGNYADAGFKDVPSRAKWAVNALVEAKVVNGKTKTSFGSEDILNRNETAKLLANAGQLDVNNSVSKIEFKDVNSAFARYVDALVKSKITQGKTATAFGATDAVKRGELALFLHRGEKEVSQFDLFVMHTNDTHAYLDNTLYRATAIEGLRVANKNNLLLDAGDVFSGDLYSTEFKGEADVKIMNSLNYDAMTFGNHEFDLGSSAEGHKKLSEFVKAANFPLLSANIDFSKDLNFKGLQTKSYTITPKDSHIQNGTILNVNGHQVGVFGLTTEETPTISSTGAVIFNDYIASAKAAVKAFEDKGITKIIALSHLGYNDNVTFDNDLELAKQVKGIDIIVGGHTHTELKEAVVKNHFGEPTLIVQTGSNGANLGTLDVTFNVKGEVIVQKAELLPTNKDKYAANETIASILAPYKDKIDVIKKESVGVDAAIKLDGERADVRTKETNLGNLIADGMLAKAKELDPETVFAFTNAGGIRASIDAGDITVGDVLGVMPYGNSLALITLKGSEINEMLERSVDTLPEQSGAFLHISGLKFEFDSTKPAGSRVGKVEVKQGDTYVPIDPTKLYKATSNTFTAGGGDNYEVLKKVYAEGRVSEPGFVDYLMFIDYIKTLEKVEPKVEGRIVDISKK
ncbi:5'-nucleotidase C-terminal domain-containing protein [Psychrobacillus sp. NPDC096623]|uniref:5'-nucleotidase C-terminal domain-containing protein n=1 Tax=Psychrobacillus sp. NPDC096623 TaxID=3364492 RepID=UPI003823A55C